MPRSPGVQRSQAKDMYWFAHGGIEPPIANQQPPAHSTTPVPDTEDESSESGSLSMKANQERRAVSEEPAVVICDSSDNSLSTRSQEKRQAVEERKRLIAEAEQEKNDAIIKKRIEREAAYEARRNAQRSNISFAFGSVVQKQNTETDGPPQRSPEIERPRMLPTPLLTLSPKTDFSEAVEVSKPLFPCCCLTGSGALFADNLMSQSMFASMCSTRGRRKNDLTPTIPYERMGPPRTAPPSRKRSVSMSRLDQLAQPRKAYVEAQKANSTISSTSKETRHSPTRPLSVASEKSAAANKHVSTSVTRRPQTAATRKPRPISIAGSIPDRTSRSEKKSSTKSSVSPSKADKIDALQSTGKSFTSNLRTSRAKSSSTERVKRSAGKVNAEKPSSTSKPLPAKAGKSLSKAASKQTPPKQSTPKQSSTAKSSANKQFTPKTSPSRKLLTNKKQAAMLVSNTIENVVNANGSPVAKSSSPARSLTPEVDSLSTDDKSSAKKIVSEEEAKAGLAERRRLVREQAEKEAELERQRQEELKRQEEERLRLEEEEQRWAEEEQLRLLEEHSEFEKEKLRKAIEEQQRKEEEEKLKREEEARLKAEQERKAKEEVEKQRIELEEKLKREEEERAERKKRLEKIMSRTRGSKSGTASPGSGSGSDAPDSTESQPEIISSEPNSLDSNMAVESLPIDNLRSEEVSASESFDFNQTVNLDSQSLSSNDLMIPSSGHTSIDSNVPATGHSAADVIQAIAPEESKSEVDDMSQSECTIKNVASQDSLLQSSVLHSDLVAVEQQTNEGNQFVGVSASEDMLVRNVPVENVEEMIESSAASNEVQSDMFAQSKSAAFDTQEICESTIETEVHIKSDDAPPASFEVEKSNIDSAFVKENVEDTVKSMKADDIEEKDFAKQITHDEIAEHDAEIKEEKDFTHVYEDNCEKPSVVDNLQNRFSNLDYRAEGYGDTFESKDTNVSSGEVSKMYTGEDILDCDKVDSNCNKIVEMDESKVVDVHESKNSVTEVKNSSEGTTEEMNDYLAGISTKEVKEDPVLVARDESAGDILKQTESLIKDPMKSEFQDDCFAKDGAEKLVKEEFVGSDELVKQEVVESDIKPVKDEFLEYGVQVTDEFTEGDIKAAKDELVEKDVKPENFFESNREPVKEEIIEKDLKLSIKEEFVEPMKQPASEDIKENFMDDLNSSETNLGLSSNQFAESTIQQTTKEPDFISPPDEDFEEPIKLDSKDDFKEHERDQNKNIEISSTLNEELNVYEYDQFSQNPADSMKNPFSDNDVEPTDQFLEGAKGCSKDDRRSDIVEPSEDNFFEYAAQSVTSHPNVDAVTAVYGNEPYSNVVEPVSDYMKDSTGFEINEMENNFLNSANAHIESSSLIDSQQFSTNFESSNVTAIDMESDEVDAVLSRDMTCDIVDGTVVKDPVSAVIEMPAEYNVSQTVAASQFENQFASEDTRGYAQVPEETFQASSNFASANPFQENEFLQQGIYEQSFEPFSKNVSSEFSNFPVDASQPVLSGFVPQGGVQFTNDSNFQYNQISKDSNKQLTSHPVELSEISCDILPDASDSQSDLDSIVEIKVPETEQFPHVESEKLKTEEQILPLSHPVDTSVLLPSKDSFASNVENLPPPNMYSSVSQDTELVLENPSGFSDNVMFESSFNPFTTSSQPLDCGAPAAIKMEFERFADHGVLKTVDEMNITNLEETNKRLGASYVYEQTDDVYKDYEPLPFEFHSQGQSMVSDTPFGAAAPPCALYSETKFSDYERHDVQMSGDAYHGFETSASAGMQRTMNPFDNFPSNEAASVSSEQVLSHYNEPNVNKELLMGILNSAIEESEDSSLDSNLSQVLHVEAVDNAGSLAATEVDQLDVLDNKVLTNVLPAQQEEIFVPKTNGYNTTYNNGCLHGDRFESAEFKADQIPVSPLGTEQDHPTSEKGNNANIPTVDNKNILDNADNVNSNKVTSNPFLISSNSQQFSRNPLDIQDDKTLST